MTPKSTSTTALASLWPTAASDRQERPVSEDEYESMPDRISQHFDRVRDLLADRTDDPDA